MAIDYAPIGYAYYNGFYFPGAITARINSTPVYDSTNRYVKWRQHVVILEFVVYPGVDARPGANYPDSGEPYQPLFPASLTTADNGYDKLRKRLTTAGRYLELNNLGFGENFKVAGSTSQRPTNPDPDFGPKPRLLIWEPLGGPKGLRVVWECEFATLDCLNTPADPFNRVGEASFNVDWSIDVMGLTTRTMSGFVEIAVERDGNQIRQNADAWRDKLNILPPPYNFDREAQSFTLSNDRRRLDFTVIDREHPSDNPLFPGCVRMDVRQTVNTQHGRFMAGNIWNFEIDGTITVAKNIPRWFAWVAFINIVKSRREYAKQFAKINDSGNSSSDASATTNSSTILTTTALSMTEEIFGRSMSFSWNFWIHCNVGSIMQASGFWQGIPGQSWEIRLNTMSEAWSPRGAANLKHEGPDFVLSLCDTRSMNQSPAASRIRAYNASHQPLFGDCPDEDSSWIFQPVCTLIEDSYSAVQSPLGGYDTNEFASYFPDTTIKTLQRSLSKAKPQVYQKRGESRYRVIYTGWAIRFGHDFTLPEVIEYGGVKARRNGVPAVFKKWTQRAIDNCLVYYGTWRVEYSLEEKPKGELFITNPDYKKFNK